MSAPPLSPSAPLGRRALLRGPFITSLSSIPRKGSATASPSRKGNTAPRHGFG